MNTTPQANRLHVGIFGETNAGKSSLFNALTETEISIVSETHGTTTDAVQKAMELLPFGPIVLIDTAGLGDTSELGSQRMAKTKQQLSRVDFAIYAIDATDYNKAAYEEFAAAAKNTPHLLVQTKSDLADTANPAAIKVSAQDKNSIENLKKILSEKLEEIKPDSDTLLGDLLPAGSSVLMVVPIDSEAPKGRLILPQSQLIRDCLDNQMIAHVATEKDIATALENLKKIDLVVTDSQVFGLVAKIISPELKLTSFSILMAHQKGNIKPLIAGIESIKEIKSNDKILICESCTHNRTHEDIGHVKIPAALQKITGHTLDFEFVSGRDFPEDLSKYALIIHCGACMLTPKEMQNRISSAEDMGIPITNYGLFLAHANGILARSIEILED